MTGAGSREAPMPPGAATLPLAWAYAASLAVLVFKCLPAVLLPQFWAEDGWVFFLQQHLASWPLLLEPYAGYLNLLPRLVAWLATLTAPTHAPAIYTGGALLIGAAALASLRHAAARTDLPFLALLAAFAVMPASTEVLGRLTNVQWLLQFHLLGVAIACRLGHRSQRPALAVAAVLASGLTGPFAIFTLLGLAAAEVVVRPGRRVPPTGPASPPWWTAPEFLALVGAALVQAALVATGAARSGTGTPGLADLAQMVAAMQSHLLVAFPLWPQGFAAGIIGLAFAAILATTDPARRRFAAIIVFVVAVQLLAAAYKFSGHVGALVPWQSGDRYFVLFRSVAWWLLLLVLLALPPLDRRRALGGFLALLLLSLALGNGRHLRQQALDDLEWPRYAKCIEAGQAVRIPVHPRPWTFFVPGTAAGPDPCGP
jgi:hypothetical protein